MLSLLQLRAVAAAGAWGSRVETAHPPNMTGLCQYQLQASQQNLGCMLADP